MAEAPVKRVGVVGAGRMGLPMARHAAAAGFQVTVFDIDPTACRKAELAGLRVASSLPELAAELDCALVVVPRDQDVMSLGRGPDGLLATLPPDALLALCSSLRPETARAVRDQAGERGPRVLDLPLVGGVGGAEDGTLTLLAGGDGEDLDRARPLLESFAKHIHHLGPVGNAQIAKTVNNLMLWAHLAAAAESLALGTRLGLDIDRLRDALADCSADSWALRRIGQIQPTWPCKDLENALASAVDAGVSLPLAERVAEVIGSWDRPALDALLAATNEPRVPS
jgi:3-hydroxyisobutyrate dehydrogenase-like beta-hydroxyacid dehydrogenase